MPSTFDHLLRDFEQAVIERAKALESARYWQAEIERLRPIVETLGRGPCSPTKESAKASDEG